MIVYVPTLAQLQEAARTFLKATQQAKGVFAIYGEMGAGKTTFIKAVCQAMGVENTVNSPTFSLINEYTKPTGEPIYHMDFYRLKHSREAVDLGCEDYFSSGCTTFIEWPDKLGEYLPDEHTRVDINVQPDGSRQIRFNESS